MKKISSQMTWFHKIAFPVFWFGFLAVFLVMSFSAPDSEAEFVFYLAPLLMGIFGFFLMRKLVWDLVDEVYDCGDSLLIKNRDKQALIPLSNIVHVNISTLMNPPRITLRLDGDSQFGTEINFSPKMAFGFNPFARSKVGEDLILRVDRARRRSFNPAD